MQKNRVGALAVITLVVGLVATYSLAQGTSGLLPATGATTQYQAGFDLTAAGVADAPTFTLTPDDSVAWAIGGAVETNMIYTPVAGFSFTNLKTGTTEVAGVVFEVLNKLSAMQTNSLTQEANQSVGAGSATFELTAGTGGGSYLAELVAVQGGERVTLVSFNFSLTNNELSELEGGEPVTVDHVTNTGAGAYNISEATVQIIEDGSIIIARMNLLVP